MKKESEIIILPQPVRLRRQVAVQDIALLVLETPRDNDQDIALADPCALLDLALYPAQALDAIVAFYADMVRPQVRGSAGKLFVQFLLWQTDADDRCAVGIESGGYSGIGFFSMVINANISGEVNQGCAG